MHVNNDILALRLWEKYRKGFEKRVDRRSRAMFVDKNCVVGNLRVLGDGASGVQVVILKRVNVRSLYLKNDDHDLECIMNSRNKKEK